MGSAINSQQCISVTVVDDLISEPTESFFLSILPVAGNAVVEAGRNLATVNILDNDREFKSQSFIYFHVVQRHNE